MLISFHFAISVSGVLSLLSAIYSWIDLPAILPLPPSTLHRSSCPYHRYQFKVSPLCSVPPSRIFQFPFPFPLSRSTTLGLHLEVLNGLSSPSLILHYAQVFSGFFHVVYLTTVLILSDMIFSKSCGCGCA